MSTTPAHIAAKLQAAGWRPVGDDDWIRPGAHPDVHSWPVAELIHRTDEPHHEPPPALAPLPPKPGFQMRGANRPKRPADTTAPRPQGQPRKADLIQRVAAMHDEQRMTICRHCRADRRQTQPGPLPLPAGEQAPARDHPLTMDTDTTDAPTQEETAPPAPPAVFINIGVPTHIEHLARNPPPRKLYPHLRPPPEDECDRAIRLQPGAASDSCRLVWIAAKIYNDNDGGDADSATDRLTFSFLVSGHAWPLAVRAAILATIPWALQLEQRLAAIEERAAKTRKGPAAADLHRRMRKPQPTKAHRMVTWFLVYRVPVLEPVTEAAEMAACKRVKLPWEAWAAAKSQFPQLMARVIEKRARPSSLAGMFRPRARWLDTARPGPATERELPRARPHALANRGHRQSRLGRVRRALATARPLRTKPTTRSGRHRLKSGPLMHARCKGQKPRNE